MCPVLTKLCLVCSKSSGRRLQTHADKLLELLSAYAADKRNADNCDMREACLLVGWIRPLTCVHSCVHVVGVRPWKALRGTRVPSLWTACPDWCLCSR